MDEMTKWQDISQETLRWMKTLGEFSPTSRPESAEVKGAMFDPDAYGVGKTYFDSSDLRGLAAACIEVADWLDKRKAAAALAGGDG